MCTTAACPHGRGVFVWLGDGPWLGDPADPGLREVRVGS